MLTVDSAGAPVRRGGAPAMAPAHDAHRRPPPRIRRACGRRHAPPAITAQRAVFRVLFARRHRRLRAASPAVSALLFSKHAETRRGGRGRRGAADYH